MELTIEFKVFGKSQGQYAPTDTIYYVNIKSTNLTMSDQMNAKTFLITESQPDLQNVCEIFNCDYVLVLDIQLTKTNWYHLKLCHVLVNSTSMNDVINLKSRLNHGDQI